MKDVVTKILTDASVRDNSGVENVLLKQTAEANPWFNVVE